jgi:hypothetical protein
MHGRCFLLSVVLVAGCGWESDGVKRLEDRYADTSGAADVAADESAPHEVDLGDVGGTGLTGRWAVRIDEDGTMTLPMNIGTRPVHLIDLFVAEVADGADEAVLTFCDQRTKVTDYTSETEVPEALRTALQADPPRVQLTSDGFAAGDVTWAWGLDLSKLSEPGAKPESLAEVEPALTDQDDDGNPGVTIAVKKPMAGKRYMARWERWHLDAMALPEGDDAFGGSLTWEITELPLGAEPAILNQPSPIEPAAIGNTMRLRRVPADYTCDDLRRDADALFPRP